MPGKKTGGVGRPKGGKERGDDFKKRPRETESLER